MKKNPQSRSGRRSSILHLLRQSGKSTQLPKNGNTETSGIDQIGTQQETAGSAGESLPQKTSLSVSSSRIPDSDTGIVSKPGREEKKSGWSMLSSIDTASEDGGKKSPAQTEALTPIAPMEDPPSIGEPTTQYRLSAGMRKSHVQAPLSMRSARLKQAQRRRREGRVFRGVFAVALLLVMLISTALAIPEVQTIALSRTVTLVDDDRSVVITTMQRNVAALLTEYDVEIGDGDIISPEPAAILEDGMTITISRAMPITVKTASGERTLYMQGGVVRDALLLAGVQADTDDLVQPGLYTALQGGMLIEYTEVSSTTEYETKRIYFKEKQVEDSSIYVGKEETVQEGEEGEKQLEIRVTFHDGVEVSRETVGVTVLQEAQDRIVHIGTKTEKPKATPKPTKKPSATKASASSHATVNPDTKNANNVTSSSITVNGVVYKYSQTMTVEITAYTHTGDKTAKGTWPKIGTVAVDPSVIPYYTEMFIPGYGFGTALDCGVHGNQIDIFLNTESECKSWGRKRNRTIYILD